MSKLRYGMGAACALLFGGLLASPETHAQETSASAPSTGSLAEKSLTELQEIVVTAQKRETRAQDTPLTVTSVSGDMLQQRNVQTLQDMQPLLPGVQIGKEQAALDITVRGISNGTAQKLGEPSVALHQDGVYTTSPNAFFFDIDRIETVYGPPGTLYGRNATAGAINIISNRPEHRWSAGADLTLGNYNSTIFQGFANAPVGSKYAFRLSGYMESRDGYNLDTYADGSRPGSDDAKNQAARVQFLAEPNSDVSFILRAGVSHIGGIGGGDAPSVTTQVASNGSVIAPDPNSLKQLSPGEIQTNQDNPRAFPTYRDTVTRVSEQGISGQLQWRNLAGMTLDYIGGMDWISAGGSAGAQLLPNSALAQIDYAPDRQFSQELRLSSGTAGRLDWIAGVFYYDQRAATSENVQINDPNNPFSSIQIFVPESAARSEAVFGNAGYRIVDSLRLSVGVRQNWDHKVENATSIINVRPAYQPFFGQQIVSTTPPEDQNAFFHHFDWKGGLDWQAGRNHLLYASYSTGYKAGGINSSGAPKIDYGDERIFAVEVGSKNTFLHKRLQLNLAAFGYNYHNFQVITANPQTLQSFVDNAATMHIRGVDLSGTGVVVHGLKLYGSVEYLEAKFGQGTAIFDEDTSSLVDVSGQRPKSAPAWSGSAGLEYGRDIEALRGTLYARADEYWVGSKSNLSYAPVLDLSGERQDVQGGYGRTDLSLTYRDFQEHYYAAAFVDNLSGKDVRVGYSNIDSGFARFDYAAPRTYGLKFGVKY